MPLMPGSRSTPNGSSSDCNKPFGPKASVYVTAVRYDGITIAASPNTSRTLRAGKSVRLVNQAKGRPISVAKNVVASISAMLLPMIKRVRARSR